MKTPYLLLAGLLLAACHHDTPAPMVVADFTSLTVADTTTALTFANLSQNATAYQWRFGDGSRSSVVSPSHTYAHSGTFQVTLRASNGTQDSAVATTSVVVSHYNVFAHTGATSIPGTYDCRVYEVTGYDNNGSGPGSPSTRTNLPAAAVQVVATGPQTITIDGIAGIYAPTASPIVLPNGPNFPFRVSVAEYSLAHFYTSGDSLLYTQQSHVGHYSTTIRYYRGKRRP